MSILRRLVNGFLGRTDDAREDEQAQDPTKRRCQHGVAGAGWDPKLCPSCIENWQGVKNAADQLADLFVRFGEENRAKTAALMAPWCPLCWEGPLNQEGSKNQVKLIRVVPPSGEMPFLVCPTFPLCRYQRDDPDPDSGTRVETEKAVPSTEAVQRCPKCGNLLRTVRPRTGEKPFVGCMGFPACDYRRGVPDF